MSWATKAIAYIPCPTCKAKVGEPCRTKTGNPYGGTWYAHTARTAPFTEEYRRGFARGERAGIARARLKPVVQADSRIVSNA